MSFLEGCLQWDARDRFTPESAMRHEWLTDGAQPSNEGRGYVLRDPAEAGNSVAA